MSMPVFLPEGCYGLRFDKRTQTMAFLYEYHKVSVPCTTEEDAAMQDAYYADPAKLAAVVADLYAISLTDGIKTVRTY